MGDNAIDAEITPRYGGLDSRHLIGAYVGALAQGPGFSIHINFIISILNAGLVDTGRCALEMEIIPIRIHKEGILVEIV